METKLDSRQGQFPATFPDTFKDFFAIMNEDEDHLELFSNLLEDKVIPRASKFNQRRYGGSLRCSTHPHSSNAAGSSASQHAGRSNSFRVNRTRGGTFANSTSALNSMGSGNGISSTDSSGSVSGSGTLFCKHIKYCCLHQQQQQKQHQQMPHKCSNQNLYQQQPQPQQTLQQQHSAHTHHFGQGNYHDYMATVGARLGPDGEDNNVCGAMLLNNVNEGSSGQQLNQQHPQLHMQKRHSIILERALDFDASCDESDTISSTSSTPTATNVPYSILKPILKQPQQNSQNQQQQQHHQQQQPQPANATPHAARTLPMEMPHRTLPQPPRGVGAYHTKHAALQRIQQQSGLHSGSKTNLTNLGGPLGSAANTNAPGWGLSGNHPNNSSNICTGNGTVMSGMGASGTGAMYVDLHSPTAQNTVANKFNELIAGGPAGKAVSGRSNFGSMRTQKSPILNRRRSSSIAANLIPADMVFNRSSAVGAASATTTAVKGNEEHGTQASTTTMPHSNTRDRIALAKSPLSGKPPRLPIIPIEGGVLTFQQAMSGAVSPQYYATTPMMHKHIGEACVSSSAAAGLNLIGGSTTALASVQEGTATTNMCPCTGNSPTGGDSPVSHYEHGAIGGGVDLGNGMGVCSSTLHGSSATITQLGNKQRQRMRTSSMPAENRKPRLAETRRAAIHCADIDLEYYRLRSFSITSHGVCNLGDSLRNASRTSGDIIFEQSEKRDAAKGQIPAYKVAMLGAAGVGKTTLTYQFTTSDYICAYDLSLDDDYGQKTVSVLVDGIETDLEIIDHPACEMSTESFCSTYNIDLFVVVYSVVDRSSFKAAEKVLQYLKDNEMLLTRGAILVGNKTDLERHREVTRQMARKVAKEIACKFIETSSGLDHNVDELLVGIVAQVKLNPQRIRNLSERDRQRLNLQTTIQKHRRMHAPQRRMVRQMSMCHANDDDDDVGGGTGGGVGVGGVSGVVTGVDTGEHEVEQDENQSNNVMLSSTGDEGIGTGSEHTASTSLSSYAGKPIAAKGPVRKTNKRTLNLESILKMGESEIEDEEELQRQQQYGYMRPLSKFELLTAGRTPFTNVKTSTKPQQTHDTSIVSTRSATVGCANNSNTGPYCDSQAEDKLLADPNRKTVSKLTNRTRIFLSSVLKFKKAISAKRRSSSSCSDLFVI